jgi:hypothetical protein
MKELVMRATHRFSMYLVAMVLFTSVLFTASGESFGGDCQDFIASRTYRCSLKTEAGTSTVYQDCFRFTSPGVRGGDFDLDIDGSPIPLTCDCKANGNVRRPWFGRSTAFHCITKIEPGATSAYALEGQVAKRGAKIQSGQIFQDSGATIVFECVEDDACGIGPLSMPSFADNPY